MKPTIHQIEILNWAFLRDEFTVKAASNQFSDRHPVSVRSDIYALELAGMIKSFGVREPEGKGAPSKLYVCDTMPKGFSYDSYEKVPVHVFRDSVTSFYEPVLITSRGRVIGIYTPLEDNEE